MSRAFDSKELREMLVSHKDWPVVFLVDSDVVGDDCWNWYAGGYSCKEGEVLDCDTDDIIPRGRTYFSREQFRYEVKKYMSHTSRKYLTDEEIDARTEGICRKYEPCWEKAVIVYVTT